MGCPFHHEGHEVATKECLFCSDIGILSIREIVTQVLLLSHDLSLQQCVQQFPDRFLQHRMPHVRCNFSERL
jgi:hypothetical protein